MMKIDVSPKLSLN